MKLACWSSSRLLPFFTEDPQCVDEIMNRIFSLVRVDCEACGSISCACSSPQCLLSPFPPIQPLGRSLVLLFPPHSPLQNLADALSGVASVASCWEEHVNLEQVAHRTCSRLFRVLVEDRLLSHLLSDEGHQVLC